VAEQHALQAGRELERVREFARHAGIEEDKAVLVYETQLERLRVGARIDRYIGVRAEKHAREMLARMHQGQT
jgi:hypothetical protein